MSTPELIEQLAQRWKEYSDTGRPCSVDDVCRDHPQLRPAVQQRIEELLSANSAGSESTVAPGSTSIADLHPTTGFERVVAGSSEFPARIGRYEVQGEIARGGMGVVLRARDPDLERTLAIKLILGSRQDDDLERRFLVEARITGKLQHPGIPPVHEVGRLADGRPFFAMKLIEGRTLSELLKERSGVGGEQARMLSVFEDICQTIAYAHQQGVIHRDLKPQNVMVGAFGEVQVMDWGLAKELSARPGPNEAVHPESTPAPQAVIDHGETHVGAILGTPAYMSPEQARGDTVEVDQLADVFSLGAILCQILTGRPPFRGDSAFEVLQQAASAEWDQARRELDECGADPTLIELTKSCLAPNKADRVQHASDIVQVIREHQEEVQERLRSVELARAQAEARAEEESLRRRVEGQRNRLWISLSLALLLIAVLAGAGGYYVQQRRVADARRAAARIQSVTQGLEQVIALRRQGRPEEARVALERTQAIEVGDPGLIQGVREEARLLALLEQLDDLKSRRAAIMDADDPRAARRSLQQAYERTLAGHELFRVGDTPAANAKRVLASEIAQELLVAIDYWVSITEDDGLLEQLLTTARLLDPHEVRDKLRDPALWRDRGELERAVQQVAVKHWTPSLASAAALRALKTGSGGHGSILGHELLTRMVRRHPQDFWLARLAGLLLSSANLHSEAAEYLRSAHALRPGTPLVVISLATSLQRSGNVEDALECLRKAIADHPGEWRFHNALAEVLERQKALDEALRHRREAIRLRPEDPLLTYGLASTLEKLKRDDAITCYQQALKLCGNDTPPTTTVVIHWALMTHYLREGEDLELGLEHARQGIQLLDSPGYYGPQGSLIEYSLRHDYAMCLYRKWRLEECVSAMQRAIEVSPPEARDGCEAFVRGLKQLLASPPGRRLAEILGDGAEFAENDERIALANFCRTKLERFATSAQLFDEAFDADPALLGKESGWPSTVVGTAALAAADAASGRGEEAKHLTRSDRLRFQRLAREWLEIGLGPFERLPVEVTNVMTVRNALNGLDRTVNAPAYSTFRNTEDLKQWPAEDQEAWLEIWKRLDDLRKRMAARIAASNSE